MWSSGITSQLLNHTHKIQYGTFSVSTSASVDTVGSFPHRFAQHHHLQLVT